jgi:hypothetical protein
LNQNTSSEKWRFIWSFTPHWTDFLSSYLMFNAVSFEYSHSILVSATVLSQDLFAFLFCTVNFDKKNIDLSKTKKNEFKDCALPLDHVRW